MILYTPVQLEEIFPEEGKNQDLREVSVNGGILTLEMIPPYGARVIRLHSTNPNLFMRPNYQPGNILALERLQI